MLYPEVQKTDSVHQGKMIVISINVALILFWLVQFFTYPIHLVPAVYYDTTGNAFWFLFGLLLRLGVITLCGLLLWAGVSWMRYVYGGLLAVGGTADLIISILMDSNGGSELLLASVELAGAAALFLSISVDDYLRQRRSLGIPWLNLILSLLGVGGIVVSASVLQLALAYTDFLTSHAHTSIGSDLLAGFAPALESDLILNQATPEYKITLEQGSFSTQCRSLKDQLGSMKSLTLPRELPFVSTVLTPSEHTVTYLAVGHYEKDFARIYITVDFSLVPPRITYVDVEIQPEPANSKGK